MDDFIRRGTEKIVLEAKCFSFFFKRFIGLEFPKIVFFFPPVQSLLPLNFLFLEFLEDMSSSWVFPQKKKSLCLVSEKTIPLCFNTKIS